MFMTLRLIALALLIAATFLFVGALKIETTSSAQNANSSTVQNANSSRARNQNDSRPAQPQQDFSKNTWELPEDADKTPNPVPTSAESIAKGKELYMDRNKGNCIFCHGDTGAGNAENLPKLRRKPADLSKTERTAAMTDGELYWKISKGITGIMPAGEKRMTEEERWNVVNYIRTLSKKQ